MDCGLRVRQAVLEVYASGGMCVCVLGGNVSNVCVCQGVCVLRECEGRIGEGRIHGDRD